MTNTARAAGRKPSLNLPLCCRFYQPVGFRLSELLKANGLDEQWGSKKRQHKLAFIVHRLIEAGIRDSRFRSLGFYVPLHSGTLRKFIGAEYSTPALEALQQLGVIECDRRYRAGVYSRSYRLSPEYRDREVEIALYQNNTLARRINKDREQRTAESVGECSVRGFVLENLGAVSISSAGLAAMRARVFRSEGEQAAWYVTVSDFQLGSHWLSLDAGTGRIFHNITSCPRELRTHLLINREPVAEVDMANAQPFFLASLYPSDHAERRRYVAAVTSGDFYAHIFRRLRNPRPWGTTLAQFTAPETTNRDRFKKHFFEKVLFASPPNMGSQVVSAFATLFPWLHSELCLRGASAVGREMQAKEAAFVLGRVLPRIRAELPECKPISVHDGVLCQRRFAGNLQRIFREECIAEFGIAPEVKIKGAGMCDQSG